MRRLLLSLGAAVILLGGFFLVIEPAQIARQLAGANLAIFVFGLVAIVAALLCWSEASRRLFVAFDTPLSRRSALAAYGAGAFGKQVLPMGNVGGPAVMAYSFDREVSLGYSRSLAIIVVAEFLSFVASLILGFTGIVVLLLFSSSGSTLRWLSVGVVIIGASVAALSVIVWYRRAHVGVAVTGIAQLLVPLVERVSPTWAEGLRSERINATLQRYYETFDIVVGDRRAVLYAFALSQLGWFFFALPLFTSALALDVHLPIGLVLFLVPAAGLATVFPVPGGLGGLEVVLAGLLTLLAAITLTTASAVVILFRLCSFWFFVLVCGVTASMAAVGVRELSNTLQSPSPVQSNDDHVERYKET